MPIVLHSTSCCDVCLEAYSWDNSLEDPPHPHAVPCGHVFCKTCLITVEPANCPLCRKPFNRDRIKKLHVDRPEPDIAAGLLQRVALAFDAHEDSKAQLSTDLDAWLSGQSDDDHVALRKAWAAFKEFAKLNDRKAHDKQKIKSYERMLNQRTAESENDHNTFKAVESSLIDHVSQLTAQIADLEAQVSLLSQRKYHHANTKNPLPAPPEPIPLDRLPAFARVTADSAQGYAGYFTPDDFPNTLPEPRADKGKGKQPAYNIYQPNTTGNMIIPGATPSQRVIPIEAPNGHAYYTPAPATAFVDGYGSGFEQGYDAGTFGVGATDSNYASTSAHQLPPAPQPDDSEMVFLENALETMRVYGAPTASAAIAPVASRPPDSAPATAPLQRRIAYIAPSRTSTDDDASFTTRSASSYSRPPPFRRSTVQVDGHGPPSSWQAPPIYAPPTRGDPQVRFNTQARDGGLAVANDASERRAARERRHSHRQSYSSWGTVHTNPAENSPAGTRGSMSDIGDLANFPLVPPGDARRNSASSSGEILDRALSNTPRQEDSRPPLGFANVAPIRPSQVHSHSFPSLETVDPADANSVPRRNRTSNREPGWYSQQLPAGPFAMATEPPPIQNALGLDLGMEATEPLAITAPTPRVQLSHFVRSWSLDPAGR